MPCKSRDVLAYSEGGDRDRRPPPAARPILGHDVKVGGQRQVRG